MIIAYGLWFAAVDSVIEDRWSQEVHRCLGLRNVYVLAFAGAVAVVNGSHNGGCEEPRGHIVGVGAHYSGRVPIWPSSHRVKP